MKGKDKGEDIPSGASNLEVFHIDGGEAFIGYKMPNGNFEFLQVPFTGGAE